MLRHQPLVVVADPGPDRAPGIRVAEPGRRSVLRIAVVPAVAEVARIASEQLLQPRPVREACARQELLEDRQPIRLRPLQRPKYPLSTVHGLRYPPCAPPAPRDRPPAGATHCAVRKIGDSAPGTAQSGGESDEGRRSAPLGSVNPAADGRGNDGRNWLVVRVSLRYCPGRPWPGRGKRYTGAPLVRVPSRKPVR